MKRRKCIFKIDASHEKTDSKQQKSNEKKFYAKHLRMRQMTSWVHDILIIWLILPRE